MNEWDLLSQVFGYLSVVCWAIILLPQMYRNYKMKSVQDLSINFLLLFTVGDYMSTIGSFLSDVPLFIRITPTYCAVMDTLTLLQYMYYRRSQSIQLPKDQDDAPTDDENTSDRRSTQTLGVKSNSPPLLNNVIVVACLFLKLVAASSPNSDDSYDDSAKEQLWLQIIKTVLTYGAQVLYIGSRLPQLIKNERSIRNGKVIIGLAPLLFMTTVTAYITYVLGVASSWLSLRDDPSLKSVVLDSLPFVLGCVVCFFMDIIILWQIRRSKFASVALQ
ncbi:hypothetical protein MP228_000452 [Amoeboaphelidium protococcarum]|nr:hypothetical protein MP228_000452 [Amoeboaphelidium protococcarum]